MEAEQLTEQQYACIEHLLTGSTKQEAAEAVGVAPYTVSRWSQEPEFIAQLNARRNDVHRANTERIRCLASKALDVMEQSLDSESDQIRMKAADQILKSLRLIDIAPPRGSETAEAVSDEIMRERVRSEILNAF